MPRSFIVVRALEHPNDQALKPGLRTALPVNMDHGAAVESLAYGHPAFDARS
jgi:hypothetical protein